MRNGCAIDLEQLVAGLDVLALAHDDARDLAGDVRRDQHLLRADIGVVGGDVAARAEIEEARRSPAAISGSATSRIMRRRFRGNAFFAGDFAPSAIDGASDTTFNEGSAITLHVLRCLVGNRLPEIFAREPELREQHADGGRIDAGEHGFGQLLDLRSRCGRAAAAPPASGKAAWRGDRSDRAGARSGRCRRAGRPAGSA